MEGKKEEKKERGVDPKTIYAKALKTFEKKTKILVAKIKLSTYGIGREVKILSDVALSCHISKEKIKTDIAGVLTISAVQAGKYLKVIGIDLEILRSVGIEDAYVKCMGKKKETKKASSTLELATKYLTKVFGKLSISDKKSLIKLLQDNLEEDKKDKKVAA